MRRALPIRLGLGLFLALAWLMPHPAQGADDPYAAWMQGRPAESVTDLLEQASLHQRWSDWYDCGLAAAAAGERGLASYGLVRAHALEPQRQEPLEALRSQGITLPPGWCERLGVLAIPGAGWLGGALVLVAGLVLGLRMTRPLPRGLLTAGVVCLVVAAPGAIGTWHDAANPFLAVVSDTALLDSTGAVLSPVPAGMVVRQEDARPWDGRVLVLVDGRRGWIPLVDTHPPGLSR